MKFEHFTAMSGPKKNPGVHLKKIEEEITNKHRRGLIKPADQLEISEAELNEEITKVLTTKILHSQQNTFYDSLKADSVDWKVVHCVMESTLLHRDSDEAQRLLAKRGHLQRSSTFDIATESTENFLDSAETPVNDGWELEKTLEDVRPDSVVSRVDRAAKIIFYEKGTQTFSNPPRERSTQTEPLRHITFSANASQSEIYDVYTKALQKKEKNKEELKAASLKENLDFNVRKPMQMETKSDDFSKIHKLCKVMERIVSQNTLHDIAIDFKYFEDASDEFRGHEGTLLPLWKFKFSEVRGLPVTSLCWNQKYQDLFAVGLGSYDYHKQGRGMVLFYSLKNPTYPEYICPTTSGVMCLDIHGHHSHLVAVGFYDGSVAVYNLMIKQQEPVCRSNTRTGKHIDCVSQVRWQNTDLDSNPSFYSVSCDGRILSWTLVKGELVFTNIVRLSPSGPVSEDCEVEGFPFIVGGTSIDFHQHIDDLFLVGTEEGKILKCSKSYSSRFLETYDAHKMPVGAVRWNPFHPKVFISCSGDWTVKIWDHTVHSPVFTFDLNTAVADVAFSPFASTVFAALTMNGTVCFFDINISQYETICQQRVVAEDKARPTCFAFNHTHPIIMVGDERGYVSSFKLSPNLRQRPKNKKGQELPINAEEEVTKMGKLLDLAGCP